MTTVHSSAVRMIPSEIRRDAIGSKDEHHQLAKRFAEMFPNIELEVAYRWAGTFGETKDGLPYIGQIRHASLPFCARFRREWNYL